jgi:hypothetical protein
VGTDHRGPLLAGLGAPEAEAVLAAAVAEAEQAAYPACATTGLQALALLRFGADDDRAAADLIGRALADAVARGALGELRPILPTAAVVLHRAGDPAWDALAATAAALPAVNLLSCPGHERFPVPAPTGTAPGLRDAVLLARARLADHAASTERSDPVPVVPAPPSPSESRAGRPTDEEGDPDGDTRPPPDDGADASAGPAGRPAAAVGTNRTAASLRPQPRAGSCGRATSGS